MWQSANCARHIAVRRERARSQVLVFAIAALFQIVVERAATTQLVLETRPELDLFGELVLRAVVDEYEVIVVGTQEHAIVHWLVFLFRIVDTLLKTTRPRINAIKSNLIVMFCLVSIRFLTYIACF